MDVKKELQRYFEKEIEQINSEQIIKEAMGYSLISNGKMIRPLVFLLYLNDKENLKDYFPIATAIEMIHVSFLIHDDLPAMDDDDLRRGLPTSHKKFGEDIAILAGDGLILEAFSQISKSDIEDSKKIKIIQLLADLSGANGGVINGQVRDIKYESITSLEMLKVTHIQKTARLFEVALLMGSIINEDNHEKELKEIGEEIGLIFQIVDDYLDVYGEEEKIGKKLGKDLDNKKITYTAFYSKEELESEINNLNDSIIDNMEKININNDLKNLLISLAKRSN